MTALLPGPLTLTLALPLLGALLLAVLPGWRPAAWLNVGFSAATLAAAAWLAVDHPPPGLFLFIDDFNAALIVLTGLVGFSTALFSAAYINRDGKNKRLAPRHLRLYHAMYQAFMFTLLLALSANNIGILWVAVEGGTLTTVLMVSLYRTKPAIEAAWKYFILCSVGIGLALFGTILVYLAAQTVMGDGSPAMAFSLMTPRAAAFQPELLNLAFVFLLVGYGTKAGLVPLHAWLPDAHAEGPTPISAVLSGLLLNVAFYVLLRYKRLLAANPHTLQPGPLLVGLGVLSVLVAAFMLYRRGDIKRLFAYSSIEHMGLLAVAFGTGGALANFAGLLHMLMHSLVKSAIFFVVGLASQAAGSQRIADIRGLTTSAPLLGWSLVVGVLAIAGLPPFGVFTSEFLLLNALVPRAPWLGLLLLGLLLLAFAALVLRLHGLAFGPPSPLPGRDGAKPPRLFTRVVGTAPIFLHMALAVAAGIALPAAAASWLWAIAKQLG